VKLTKQAARHRERPSRTLAAAIGAAILAGAAVLAVTVVAPHGGHDRAAGFTTPTPTPAASGTRISAPTGPSLSPAPASPSPSAALRTSARATPPRTSAASSAPASSGSSGPAPLAGRIRPGVTYQGVATEYAAADGNGACLFGPAANMMIAAMNYTDYETSKACGAHILVRAANGASITVLITNECPLPCAPGQLDLSQQAFVALAGANLGRMPITWKLLSPADAGTISVRYKSGSSQYWCGIQVIGHRNPVASLEVRVAGGWRQLPRTGYNYFLSADGAGCGGTIRITDIYGQQLVVNGISISPDVAQPTQVQFAQHA
jgi:expansin (peptidoglycan-binding protein)